MQVKNLYEKYLEKIINKIDDTFKDNQCYKKIAVKIPVINKYKKSKIEIKKEKPQIYNKIASADISVKMLKKKFIQELRGEETNILTKETDIYTTFLVYIDENNVSGKVPPEVQTLSDLNISKKKRQELLKKALEDGHVYKINSTTYGITRYKGEFNYE